MTHTNRQRRGSQQSKGFSCPRKNLITLLICIVFNHDHSVHAWTPPSSLSTKASRVPGSSLPIRIVAGGRTCSQERVLFLQATPKDSNGEDNTDGEDEDDGWGTTTTFTTSRTTDTNKAILESLKSERAQKSSSSSSSSMKQSSSSSIDKPERDLFIPIVTMISVIGFSGLYGYETLRLYLNGELYLPGGN